MTRSRVLVWLVLVCAGLLTAPAWSLVGGDAASARGRQIAAEADRRARGFGAYRAQMKMVLSDRRGKETVRKLEVSTLEASEDVNKSLVYFHSPRDIRGTSLLTVSHRDREDDQWLYLPALRRTKRIAPANRASPFMGSEFTYEDLSSTRVEDFDYHYVDEETYRETDCFVIERYPKYAGTGYSKQKVWLDQKEYRVLKIVYWDTKKRKLKSLGLGRYDKYRERFWEPAEALMVNHRTKASTRLIWSDYEFDAELDERDFSQSALRTAK